MNSGASDPSVPDVSLGEICGRAGVTRRTVHYYEEAGLIQVADRTKGGHRRYAPETVQIILAIRTLQESGLSLKQIRRLLALTESEHTQGRWLTKRLRKNLKAIEAALREQIALLTTSHEKLVHLIQTTDPCDTCNAKDCGACDRLESLRTLGLKKRRAQE